MAKSKSKEIASWDVNVWFKGWSLGYLLTTTLIKIWFFVYYRRAYWQGSDKVDWSKPILLVSNHQNAFLDALNVLINVPEQIYFMTRSDVFYTRIARFFLKMYHMIPIFRKRDGVNIHETNERIFNLTYNMLANGRSILIFPEGNCIPRNTLRRFQKGTARMAFGAMEAYDFDLDLQIVPVGVNYSDHTSFRGEVFVNYGAPMPVSNYLPAYHENSAKGILNITRDMQQQVQNLLVDVPDTENRPTVNFALKVAARKKRWQHWGSAKLREVYEIKKRIGDRLSALFDSENPAYQEVLEKAEAYGKNIEDAGMDDDTVFRASTANPFSWLAGRLLLLIVMAPLAIPGWLIHKLPLKLIDKKATNVNDEQFISSIRFLLQMVLFPLLYVVFTGIAAAFIGWSLYLLLIFAAFPVSLIAYLRSGVLLKQIKGIRNWQSLRRSDASRADELLSQREELINLLSSV